MANSDWEKILRNPARFSGQDIELEGVITGSLIEQITPRQGIQTVISPHPTRSGLSLWVDDMDAKVLVFLLRLELKQLFLFLLLKNLVKTRE